MTILNMYSGMRPLGFPYFGGGLTSLRFMNSGPCIFMFRPIASVCCGQCATGRAALCVSFLSRPTDDLYCARCAVCFAVFCVSCKYWLRPNAISYGAAISAFSNGQEWAHALRLLREMLDSVLELSVTSYSAAISACEKG